MRSRASGSRPLRPVPDSKVASLTVAMALLLVACVGGGPESGVNVKSVATDLVYGIPPTPQAAAPADQDPVPEDPLDVEVRTGDQGSAEPESFEPEPIDTIDRGGPCPTAPPNEFPAPVTDVVEGTPQAGAYTWRVEGTQNLGPPIGRTELPKTQARRIEDVEETETGHRFTMVAEEVSIRSDRTVFTTYEIRQGLPPTSTQEEGVYLTEIVRHGQDGSVASRFNPSPAVQILPLPVEPGAEVDSVGVDPQNFAVLRVEGTVMEKKRIDACGKVVDSWLVDAFTTFVNPDGEDTRRNYDYGVATQRGGSIVFERVATPCEGDTEGEDACVNDPDLEFEARLGQIDPEPLEEG